jgi:cytochrome oxidase Cu insertion factor (SCO1/SenC/PrrC family)
MAVWYCSVMRSLIGVLAVSLWLGPSTLLSQQSAGAAAVDVETLGPKVGELLPDFSLPDQHGQQRSMKSLIGANGAVIVFFRSADW